MLVTHDFDDVVRLATHVLLLEGGRGVACGRLEAVMSRPDLPWLRDAVGLGSVFDAVVSGVDAGRGLAQLSFAGGSLQVPATSCRPAARVRVRIPAREVILATTAPAGLSLHNVLTATVAAVHAEPASDRAIVQLHVGNVQLHLDDVQLQVGMAPCGSWPRSRATPSPGSDSRPARPCTR